MMKSNLKNIRSAMGLSREELADYLGLSVSCVTQYENNIRRPRLYICYAIIDLASSKGVKIRLEELMPRSMFS